MCQSNGKAESAVKEAKKILLKCRKAGSDAFWLLLTTGIHTAFGNSNQPGSAPSMLIEGQEVFYSCLLVYLNCLQLMKTQPTPSFACASNSKLVITAEAPVT